MMKVELSRKELEDVFFLRNGKHLDWLNNLKIRWGYYKPDIYYEALVKKVIDNQVNWLDVGGGKAIFPNNLKLSKIVARQAKKLVVVDPSKTVFNNPFAHEKICASIENFESKQTFDIITLRMVAEHIDAPDKLIQKLDKLLSPDGIVIIFTVYLWSPVTIISKLLPFKLHYPIKKIFFGGEKEDTFPTHYKMNTRKTLRKLFQDYGFKESYFVYLDDLSTLAKFDLLSLVELLCWKLLKVFRLGYPEKCILAIFKKG